jgi:hypothetical protein
VPLASAHLLSSTTLNTSRHFTLPPTLFFVLSSIPLFHPLTSFNLSFTHSLHLSIHALTLLTLFHPLTSFNLSFTHSLHLSIPRTHFAHSLPPTHFSQPLLHPLSLLTYPRTHFAHSLPPTRPTRSLHQPHSLSSTHSSHSLSSPGTALSLWKTTVLQTMPMTRQHLPWPGPSHPRQLQSRRDLVHQLAWHTCCRIPARYAANGTGRVTIAAPS